MKIATETSLIIARELTEAKQTVSVAESSTAGLISAALLAVPGASAYYGGGAIIYTMRARRKLLQLTKEQLNAQTPLTDAYVTLCAEQIKNRLKTTWGLAELGATGPAGTPYGHPPGICVLALVGPINLTVKVATGHGDRETNMATFTSKAIELLHDGLRSSRG
jgi:nicotinamide-nucleotide amidase